MVITGIDSIKVLNQAIGVARDFRLLNETEMQALREKAKPAATGEYELFKTSNLFDSTAEHPEWLGEEPKRMQQMVG